MKRLAGLGLIASLVVLVMPSAQANHAWGNYHWGRTSNPFSVRLIDSMTGVWDSLLPAVSSDWTASSVLNTSIEGGSTSFFTRVMCNPVAGKVRVCNANYGPNLWFGEARVWITNGHISQATTKLNDFYFTGSYGNNTARRHVLCQEVGHDFGLDHQHGVPTCMDDNNSTLNTASYMRPNQHDYDELVSIYSHLDSVNTSRAQARRILFSPDRVERVGDQVVFTFIAWVR